jgi:hypothetical protein
MRENNVSGFFFLLFTLFDYQATKTFALCCSLHHCGKFIGLSKVSDCNATFLPRYVREQFSNARLRKRGIAVAAKNNFFC